MGETVSRPRPYVGLIRDGARRQRVVFHSDVTPTQETHGDAFVSAEGPFQTIRGARIFAVCANAGWVMTQDAAEKLAAAADRRTARLLAKYPRSEWLKRPRWLKKDRSC